MLAGRRAPINILYNALKDEFSIKMVILEEPVPRIELLERRAKKLGLLTVAGQLLFRATVVPYLELISRRRIAEIKTGFGLDDAPIDNSSVVSVSSVNSDETIALLRQVQPRLVIVSGTRIISERVLECVSAKFINTHVGITPLYRGVHGAYWALVEKNKQACGVTVHFIDRGIDTGKILAQAIIEPTDQDNFATYPFLQLGVGIPLLKQAITDVLENKVEIQPCPEGRSKLWSHPTIWGYLWGRIVSGVK